MSLEGRHFVVTGGGTGVGAAVAARLAAAGAAVTLMGRTRSSLEAQGLPFELCDVTDAGAVAQAFAAARQKRGPVLGVVANAGAAETAPFDRLKPETLASLFAVNVAGVANAWQAAVADMREAGWGRMIAIASLAGLKGYAYSSAYCATKHAVVGLTRSLAIELAPTGITVNAVCPGFVDTPMLERSVANIVQKTGRSEAEARKALAAGNPQKRFIEPEEIASSVLWLSGSDAASVNGHTLVISGGET